MMKLFYRGDRVSLWYMHDDHTFSRLEGRTLDDLCKSAFELGQESPCGMLCQPVIVGDDGSEKERVGINVHHPYRGTTADWWNEITKWKCAILEHDKARELIRHKRFA